MTIATKFIPDPITIDFKQNGEEQECYFKIPFDANYGQNIADVYLNINGIGKRKYQMRFDGFSNAIPRESKNKFAVNGMFTNLECDWSNRKPNDFSMIFFCGTYEGDGVLSLMAFRRKSQIESGNI